MSKITINGTTYEGNSVVVNNGNVIIDGKKVNTEDKQINISVHGNIDTLNVDYCNKIDITGNVQDVKSTAGHITCGDVTGNVNTVSGDIECGTVGSWVNSTSGDISAGNVNGSVKTISGDIEYKK